MSKPYGVHKPKTMSCCHEDHQTENSNFTHKTEVNHYHTRDNLNVNLSKKKIIIVIISVIQITIHKNQNLHLNVAYSL